MSNGSDHWQVSYSDVSQAAIDAAVPNGTYRVTMQMVHDGTKAANLTLTGDNYPNTPVATNYAAMQAVNPGANFTVYWNAFTGGTTNDVIVASLVANQFAPYGSITNSPLPGTSGVLTGTSRAWVIPGTALLPKTTFYVRVVFYKAVSTNKTAYAGVTGYAVYGTGTTIPLLTTSPLPAPPNIVTQPTNQTVFVGSNVTMAVTATGTGLSYQWRRSSTNLASATSPLYSIANAQTNHSGNYSVMITNAGGAVTSSVAVLTVLLPPKPTITTQPTNQTVYVGSNVTMAVVASGMGLGYQWRRSNTNLIGATSALYSLPNVQTNASGNYLVVVTNAGGAVTSSVATLTVPLPSSPPPRLNMSVTGGSAVLSWPVNTVTFQLQAAPALGVTFTNVPAALTTNTGYVSTTVPVTSTQRFFRLYKP
ncbi:MAG TPA: immunoglobulin domain-containing protein [Verrucomicrobiae bacterium]|nr:immunoglobulin domain-containing protein [Verrucomicrobiae bacterium]